MTARGMSGQPRFGGDSRDAARLAGETVNVNQSETYECLPNHSSRIAESSGGGREKGVLKAKPGSRTVQTSSDDTRGVRGR